VLNPKNALLDIGCVLPFVASCEAGNTAIIVQRRKFLRVFVHRIMLIVIKVAESVSVNVLYAYTSGKLKHTGLILSNMYFIS
jgi:hypothetical protein